MKNTMPSLIDKNIMPTAISDEKNHNNNLIYVRESTEAQAQYGSSIESQIFHAKKLAEKMGIDLLDENIYIEIISASKKRLADRPKLNEVLTFIQKIKPEYLFVWKRDRLARDIVEYFKIWNITKKSGTQIIFTSSEEPPIGEGVFAGFQETIFMAVSQLESQILGQRIRDTRKSLVESGKIMIGTPPYGYVYESEKKEYIAIDEQIDVYLKTCSFYLEENLGYCKIAVKLNELKIPSPKGGMWKSSTVARMLKNPFYCGLQRVSYREELNGRQTTITKLVKTDKIKPCISEETFNKISEKIESKKINDIPPRQYTTSFLFSGLIKCDNCGSPIIGRNSSEIYKNVRKHYPNYRCTGYTCGKKCSCSISKSKIENAVLNEMFKFLGNLNPDFIAQESEKQLKEKLKSLLTRSSYLEKETQQISKRVEKNQLILERNPSELRREYLENRIEEMLKESLNLQYEKFELEKEINCLKKMTIEKVQLLNKLGKYETMFTESTPEIKRAIILNIVNEIRYDNKNRIVTVFLNLNYSLFNSCGLSSGFDGSMYDDHSLGKIHFKAKIA